MPKQKIPEFIDQKTANLKPGTVVYVFHDLGDVNVEVWKITKRCGPEGDGYAATVVAPKHKRDSAVHTCAVHILIDPKEALLRRIYNLKQDVKRRQESIKNTQKYIAWANEEIRYSAATFQKLVRKS
ncbi:MAG: hypothetical protein KGI50_07555 [Patescibacteria group bacterium]|nr:hypothetical protein [Patescibacteria group bacterium]MDE2438967.1 hypothetical protein [Patescibacteria group bacterium]